MPAAHAVHLRVVLQASPPSGVLLVANRLRLYGRRHSPVATTAFWAVLVLREASRAAVGKATSRAALSALLSLSYLATAPGRIASRRSDQALDQSARLDSRPAKPVAVRLAHSAALPMRTRAGLTARCLARGQDPAGVEHRYRGPLDPAFRS